MRANPRFLLPIVGLFIALPLYSKVGGAGPTAVELGIDDPGATLISKAIRSKQSGFVVETTGLIEDVAPFDADAPEQRFSIRLDENVTVLVAHEIEDQAVPLAVGDRVRVRGRYQWTEEGGIIVGTSNSSDGIEGWILHNGLFYPSTGRLLGRRATERTAD